MDWEKWVMLAIAGVVIPTVGWLVKEVISLRRDYVRLQTQAEERHERNQEDWKEQKETSEKLTETLGRMDRNVVRLCENADVQYD